MKSVTSDYSLQVDEQFNDKLVQLNGLVRMMETEQIKGDAATLKYVDTIVEANDSLSAVCCLCGQTSGYEWWLATTGGF